MRKVGHAGDVYLFYLKNPAGAELKLQPSCANCDWAKVLGNKELSDKYGQLGTKPLPTE